MSRRSRRLRRGLVVATALVAALAAALPGTTSARIEHGAGTGARNLAVFAAASLTEVFPKIDSRPQYNFASSNLSSADPEGAPADVFAAASPREPAAAYDEGLCERPVTFAYNKLVVIVPESNPAQIRSVFGLTKPGVKVVIAQQGVPVGDYTRLLLRNLGIAQKVLANVVSEEPDVKSVVSKVVLGEADAGFVYRTDVAPVADDVNAIRLPTWSQPPVRYQICVVTASDNKTAARAFMRRVLGPIGRTLLKAHLFGVPQ